MTQSLAVLDATLSPEWQYRYYSFDSNWADNVMMASMRNGSGDSWSAVITQAGVGLVGLAHEAPTFVPGAPKPWIFRGLPDSFVKELRDEPAFDTANSTFCIWWTIESQAWSCGIDKSVDDGSAELLGILCGRPEQYVQFAQSYYSKQLNLADVQAIYDHKSLNVDLVKRLNADVDLDAVLQEANDIGYQ